MSLPTHHNLPTNLLAGCFKKTVATYKFYWLLSIMEFVEAGEVRISKHRIFARMVANAWYTVNYFHISFGKSDLLQEAIEKIIQIECLTIDEKKNKLIAVLETTFNTATKQILNHFDKTVPHWFLSPWFPKHRAENDADVKKRIYESSKFFDQNCMYALQKEEIIINPAWINYLQINCKLIKDFCYWNLALFLQVRNPNIPDIPNKLIKPAVRNTLTKQKNDYWKNVFQKIDSIPCIFTEHLLTFDENNYAIDHFVPYAFVSHDLIWNLSPICKSYNSTKSDRLPLLNLHFDKFFDLQLQAFEINKELKSAAKYIEEFLTIFPSLEDFSKDKFRETIQPLITIAHNNGFAYLNE